MFTHVIKLLFGCKHQFGFPITRRGTRRTYQVCVCCGAEYEYDWKSMTRMGQIQPKAPPSGIEAASAKPA